MKVVVGSLWIGKEWKDAILLSLETTDCGIEPVYQIEYEQPNSLLSEYKQIIIGYQIYGYGNGKKYKTRIPKQFNNYVKQLIK